MRRAGKYVYFPPSGLTLPWNSAWTPEGVIAALQPLVGKSRLERLRRVLECRIDSVTALIEAPQDPNNAAAVVRTADALGIHSVHVIPHQTTFQAGRLVTKGSEQWVATVIHKDAVAAVRSLTDRGYALVSAHPGGDLEPRQLRQIDRLALLFGNETDGLSPALLAAAAQSVRIPMLGFVDSLNISVSAGILMAYAAEGRPGDLSSEQYQLAHARWLYESVQSAGRVLEALPPR